MFYAITGVSLDSTEAGGGVRFACPVFRVSYFQRWDSLSRGMSALPTPRGANLREGARSPMMFLRATLLWGTSAGSLHKVAGIGGPLVITEEVEGLNCKLRVESAGLDV